MPPPQLAEEGVADRLVGPFLIHVGEAARRGAGETGAGPGAAHAHASHGPAVRKAAIMCRSCRVQVTIVRASEDDTLP